jgi:hypothetical protein
MGKIKQPSRKRLNYFTGQLLGEGDFTADQRYYLDRMSHHVRAFHRWGVAGLEVQQQGPRDVRVGRGSALDSKGREIVIEEPIHLALTEGRPQAVVFVTIEYEQGFEDADLDGEQTGNHSRVTEFAVLQESRDVPPTDGSTLPLARVQFDGQGNIASIDQRVRTPLGTRIGAASVGPDELAPAAVTREKLDPSLRSGWVRLPFKPSSMRTYQVGGAEQRPSQKNDPRDFFIGATLTYCDENGAKGSMGIPVPPGATRLKQVAIAGPQNRAGIRVEVYRCGWNVDSDTMEEMKFSEQVPASAKAFRRSFALNWELNAESHAISLYVVAEGKTDIALVAAEFE